MATDQLTNTFAALADPTRRAILARLAEGEATVNELARPFPMSVQAVSKHLKALEPSGEIDNDLSVVSHARSVRMRRTHNIPRTT